MKRLIAFLMAALMLAGALVACEGTEGSDTTAADDTTLADVSDATTAENTTVADETTASSGSARDPSETYNILFIGNSFTYYNDMPTVIFKKIAQSAGYNVNVQAITNGGHFLWEFASDTDSYGKQVTTFLKAKKYDIVIIQEQSGNAISNPGLFYDGVRALAQKIKANGAEMWLYETWGYKAGYSKLPTHGGDTATMEMKLRAAYTAIAEEVGAKVAYAGIAMTDVHTNHSKYNLYNSDLFHPSELGSTLVAYTLFAEIFGYDVRQVSYNGTLSASVAEIFKEAAYNAAFGEVVIDEAHKTTSVGITNKLEGSSSDIDVTKTVNLTAFPSSDIISYIVRDNTATGNGWVKLKSDATKTFSGIRGDNDKIAALDYSASSLTEVQRAAIADIRNGVSVIGADHMNSSKKGYTTAIENLVNGHWGSSYMATVVFDGKRYNIGGEVDENGEFAGLITLNFGKVCTFDAIGWMSGSLYGFPQIQKVYVSDDGINWTVVESACYDAMKLADDGKTLTEISSQIADPWNGNKAGTQVFFSMGNVSGKYIRIGIIGGGEMSGTNSAMLDLNAPQEINTREIIVFGKEGQ